MADDKESDNNRKKLTLIAEGKNVADLIVACHRELGLLTAFFEEWVILRRQSILLLEQLADTVTKRCKSSDKIEEILNGLNIATRLADNVPHQGISWGTRIASTIGGFFVKMFSTKMTKDELDAKEFEIKQTFQTDIDSSSDVYIHGVRCGSQFEETRQCIKKFHLLIQENTKHVMDNDSNIQDFFYEISCYNPDNISVFYNRLRFAYERLLENCKSEDSKHFIRVFQQIPDAIPVISKLPWRFETDGFDASVVNAAWEELFALFCNPDEFEIKEFLAKIRNCIFFLNKERRILERTVSDLQMKKV